MKKKKKNKIWILVIILSLAVALGAYYYFVGFENKNALTLEEDKWIDKNKYNVIDVAMFSDVPVISYDGKGLAYDFLDYVNDKYSLTFSVVSYKIGSTAEYDYKMNVVDTPSSNDIILLKDNLILVRTDNIEYTNRNQMNNLKIGILASESETLGEYFKDYNITFVTYDTYDKLKEAIVNEKSKTDSSQKTIDGIIIQKDLIMEELIKEDLTVSYEFTNLNKYIVLESNGDKELNGILKKSYNAWENKKYDDTYKSYLLDSYYKFANVSDSNQKKLNSKSYAYGFIDYGIFNYLSGRKIKGISSVVLKDFSKTTGISISYTKYNSISRLTKDFVDGKVDFMLNIGSEVVQDDAVTTFGIMNKNIAIVSGVKNTIVATTIDELKRVEVLTIKDSFIEKYLMDNDVKVKLYNNLSDLVKDFKEDSIIAVDLENFNYYKSSYFKDTRINFILDNNEVYNFIINGSEENKSFSKLFNFYLNFTSMKTLIADKYQEIAYEHINLVYILMIVIVILLIYLVLDSYNHLKAMLKRIKNDKKINLSKEDKIKYIDQLTSLKNRAYLNSKIETWDESEVYPQAIIVIDLNNVSYINDNYGREEGDKVITEAANILIMHQLQNSEVIRTDGNEFLIYLVGYTEKQVIAYLRKLNRELKGLSHGFGAASGYSIITDAVKTIDDAVNEAVIEMKNNKEDIEY